MSGPAKIVFPTPSIDVSGDLCLPFAGHQLVGMSVATVATAIAVETFDLAVDMGRCSPLLAAQETVLLTHCHSDHTAGLLAWLSARVRRHRGAPARIAVPKSRRPALLSALESWPDLDVVRRRIDLARALVPIEAGDILEVGSDGWARSFALHHTTVSQGWHIGEVGRVRARVAIAYDSTILPVREQPELLDADLAVVDCTFVEPGSRVAARLSGHAHLQEWVDLAPELPCDRLVLAHLPQDLKAERLLELLADWPASGPDVTPWLAGPPEPRA